MKRKLSPWCKEVKKTLMLLVIEFVKSTLCLKIKDSWSLFRTGYVDRNGKQKGRDLDYMLFFQMVPLMYGFVRTKSSFRKKMKDHRVWKLMKSILKYLQVLFLRKR